MAVRLSLKNVGAVRFAPLVLFDVLYPILLCSMRFNGTEPEMIEVYLLQMSQVIFPFFSAWDVIFVLREYNESEGNEVLFVNKRVSAGTICAVIFCAMLLNISIMMAASCLLIPDFVFEFMRIIPACVFFFGMCGFIISISKSAVFNLMPSSSSAAISILGGVLYLIANYIFCINKEVPMFYMSFGLVSSELVLQSCLPLLVLGIALAVAGNIISKKRTVYN